MMKHFGLDQKSHNLLFHWLVALQVKKHFINTGQPADVKYIDPTYMIRACRANASDSIMCSVLGQNAVSASTPITKTPY